MKNYFESKPPMYSNGTPFLGYKLPAAQTFTSFSPSNDMNAYLNAITGMSGWKQRQLLQSRHGTEILNQAANGQLTDAVSNMVFPGYHSRASCQTDSDCGTGQTCYTFNDQVFGAQQGPTCSDTVYPEIMLGNQFNNGKPLRQYSNYCMSDTDCKKIDEYTGKAKKGMMCNHFYKGPNLFEDIGMCQVEYESGGRRYTLQQPPGWKMPIQEKLHECETNSDCGESGVNGWSRCVKSGDNKSYCVWPGQTNIPHPSELKTDIKFPGMSKPTSEQQKKINAMARAAGNPNFTPGGSLSSGPEPTPLAKFK